MIFNYNNLYTEIYINGREPSIDELVFKIDEDVFYISVEKNHFKVTRYLIDNHFSKTEKNNFHNIMSMGITLCSRKHSIDSLKEIINYFEENDINTLNLIIRKNAISFSFGNKYIFNLLKKYIDKNIDEIVVNNVYLTQENSALYEIIDFFGIEKIEKKCIEFGFSKDHVLEKINDVKLNLKLKDELKEDVNISSNKNKRKI